ncbi:tetratricopeptide repeat protein [Neochlamydia sp. AcF95]|uniref:tetratricopeptide repeat protein n=1 Tax=Neochlamydia sp. AcF95 TaxID=2795734 RepID=UPI001BC8EA50|nr:tetratricopeptide repeat protein [Neochlamydia sp. AcF95]
MNLESLNTHPLIFPAFNNSISRLGDTSVYAEIALKIFKKLKLRDLCQAKFACKEWKHLIKSSFLDKEEAYTQALNRAIQKNNPLREKVCAEKLIQEAYCIEKLGDIYQDKGTSETLLQAAGLYTYALQIVSDERKKFFEKKLLKTQHLLIKSCNGKVLDNNRIRKEFKSNRQALKIFREKIEEIIHSLPETPSFQEVKELYGKISQDIKAFFSLLVNQALDVLCPAPCEYAMIGFGSLAREEMTPYSDLEFGILIKEDSDENKKYFRNLTNLIHLKVINLGETILPALNIPCLKAIGFFDGITPRGFAFDGAGVEGKGCKTPLGNGKTFELIQTLEKMAQYIAKDEEKQQWWHDKEPHLPMELLNFTHLLGSNELTEQYRKKVQENLVTPYQEGLNLRYYLAKKHLVQEDMIAFNPGMGSLERQGMLFKAKNDFYRFPHLALDRLALLKEIVASDTFGRIDQLNKLGVITEGAAEKLKDWMSIALFMRLKTYFHYQAQQEMMNPLIKPFGFNEPELIKKQFAVDHETLEKVKKIYRIFIPFYQAMRDFLAGHENNLSSSDLNDDLPQTQGYIALRLFQSQEAKKWFHEALKKDSENFESLNELGLIYEQEGSLKLAAKYLNQARKVALNSHRENKFFVASVYNNLISLYPTEVNFENAIDYANQALKILRELVGEDHPYIAGAYNNLGFIYQEQGNLGKAKEHSNKSLTINLKFFKENPANVARDYNSLGMICLDDKDLIKAMDFVNQALNINLNFYSEMHPNVALNYNNLATIYQKQGKLEKAMENAKKALAIDLKFFGENHPAVATDYNNLGDVYREQGNFGQAAEYVRKSLKINLEHFGETHPKVAKDYNNLGICIRKNDLKEAEYYINKSLNINLKLYGRKHFIVACSYDTLAIIYEDKKKLKQACKCFKKALAINQNFYGKSHSCVALNYNNLGRIYTKLGNLKKALKYVKQALKINLKLFGENYPAVATSYNTLGQIYKEKDNLSLAIEYIKKALRISIELYGIHHSMTKAINVNLKELK